MTAGHMLLKSLFGEDYLPSVGWQIDPFGVETNSVVYLIILA